MKWEITYRNRTTFEEYSLAGVEAENYNEAVKIAKRYRGENEDIADIKWIGTAIFDNLTREIENGFIGRMAK